MPVSTAGYNPCGWRAWLNNTTITLGMNNVFDQDPPFVASNIEDGYDQFTSYIQGRTWLCGVDQAVLKLLPYLETPVDPPFMAGASENGYDESLATIKGRFWYVQLKKRF